MAINKTQKTEILNRVADIAKTAKSAVFVNFHGLTVTEITQLRKSLRDAGVKYTVAKKTLAKKAFTERGFKGDMPTLDGELAIAYGDDLIAPAREVREFEKKFEGKVAIMGGIFEDKYMSQSEMQALAAIPTKHVLLGMFVNLINSPIQRLVIVMSEIAKTKTA
jgi:large subunit ribosomal protein L10